MLSREGIDLMRERENYMVGDKKMKALAAVGRFSSGRRDVSGKHDPHLAEAYSMGKSHAE
jgi:hypothetical protein